MNLGLSLGLSFFNSDVLIMTKLKTQHILRTQIHKKFRRYFIGFNTKHIKLSSIMNYRKKKIIKRKFYGEMSILSDFSHPLSSVPIFSSAS